jgi:hypothetical protein
MGAGRDLWKSYEAVYSKLDYSGVASFYADDVVHVDAAGRHEGREAIGAYFEAGDKPFSDINMETPQVIEEGPLLSVEWVWRGTNTGPMLCLMVRRSQRHRRPWSFPVLASCQLRTGRSPVSVTTSTTLL